VIALGDLRGGEQWLDILAADDGHGLLLDDRPVSAFSPAA